MITKLNESKKNKILKNLEKNYKCDILELKKYNFYIQKSFKVFISKIDLNLINLENLNLRKIVNIGLYFGRVLDDKFERFRLSIYGTQMIIPKNNYIVLDRKFFEKYLARENLFESEIKQIKKDDFCEFLIVSYDKKNYGVVSKKQEMYLNYIPKERKIEYNKLI